MDRPGREAARGTCYPEGASGGHTSALALRHDHQSQPQPSNMHERVAQLLDAQPPDVQEAFQSLLATTPKAKKGSII